MLNFLRIFYEAIYNISGSLNVMTNLFIREIYKVQGLLKALIKISNDELSKMAKKILTNTPSVRH